MVLPAGTLVKVLADFNAVKEDEISVNRGESIQVGVFVVGYQVYSIPIELLQ